MLQERSRLCGHGRSAVVTDSVREGGHVAWRTIYARIAERLPDIAARAPPLLCLSNACVDVILRLSDLEREAQAGPPGGMALFDTIRERAARGVGGEIRWPEAHLAQWLGRVPGGRRALGGTGPQGAWALSRIGAPALTALADRSEGLLGCLPPGLMVAHEGAAVPGRDLEPSTRSRPEIFIVEFSAGEIIAGVTLPRSSRCIVRMDDPGLERDPEFAVMSVRLAPDALALVGGLGSVQHDRIDGEIAYLRQLAAAWRSAGLSLLHLELGGYDDRRALTAVLLVCGELADSLGMSAAEFSDVSDGLVPTPENLLACAERLGVQRLCVHADDWAASVTHADPEREREALVCGSLLAAARAQAGRPVSLVKVPTEARFVDPLHSSRDLGRGRHHVSVSTPHLSDPAATLGLGDTFSAGCMLLLR